MSPKITNPELKRSDFVERIRYNARYGMGIGDDQLTNQEAFEATARSLREKLIDGMLETEARYARQGSKRLYYLSMEFLMGRALGNGLYNQGAEEGPLNN